MFIKLIENRLWKFLSFGVLVGAFSVFGHADTGNPVQILGVFGNFTPNQFPEGLI